MDEYWLSFDDAQDLISQFEDYGAPELLFLHLKSILFEIAGEPNPLDRMLEIDECLRVAVYLHFLNALITSDKEALRLYPKKTILAWQRELAETKSVHLYELGRLAELGKIVLLEEFSELVDVMNTKPPALLLFQNDMNRFIETISNFQKKIPATAYAASTEDDSFEVSLIQEEMSASQLQKKITYKRLDKLFKSDFVMQNYTKYAHEYDQWEWYDHPTFGEIAVHFGNPTDENENHELIITVPKRSFIPLLLSTEIHETKIEDSCRQYYFCHFTEDGKTQVAYRMRRSTLHADYTLNEDLTLEHLSDYETYFSEAGFFFDWVLETLAEEEKQADEADHSRADLSVVLTGQWQSTSELKEQLEVACKRHKLTHFELVENEIDETSEIEWRSSRKFGATTDRVAILLKIALVLKDLSEAVRVDSVFVLSSGRMLSGEHLSALLNSFDRKSSAYDKETLLALSRMFLNAPLWGELDFDKGETKPIIFSSGLQLFGLSDVYVEVDTEDESRAVEREDAQESNADVELLLKAILESLIPSKRPKIEFSDENEKKFASFTRNHPQFQPFGYRRVL